jgi:hypothetical protein
MHFSALLRTRLLPASVFHFGIPLFILGLIPMWIVVVFSIVKRRKSESNWFLGMIADCPNPHLTGRLATFLWFYFCGFFGLALFLSDSTNAWAHYLGSAGKPGIFLGFYGAGFLNALAEWTRSERVLHDSGLAEGGSAARRS